MLRISEKAPVSETKQSKHTKKQQRQDKSLNDLGQNLLSGLSAITSVMMSAALTEPSSAAGGNDTCATRMFFIGSLTQGSLLFHRQSTDTLVSFCFLNKRDDSVGATEKLE